MRKKHLSIIIILLLVLIAGGLYLLNMESKKIVLSQEVWDIIDFSDLSLHLDRLMENGFDYDGFSQEEKADVYTYRRSMPRLAAQLFLYPTMAERGANDSQPTFVYRRSEYQGDTLVYIIIDDPNSGRLKLWVEYDRGEKGKVDSKLINTILLKLFTEYSFENTV